jgi:hypothetical protein
MANNLTLHNVNNIVYTKADGEESERTVIPMSVPGANNVRAIDVGENTEEEIASLVEKLADYGAYKQQILNSILSFEQYVETSTGEPLAIDVKWRTFKADRITEPDEE